MTSVSRNVPWQLLYEFAVSTSMSAERSGHYAKRVSPVRYDVTVQRGALDGKLSDRRYQRTPLVLVILYSLRSTATFLWQPPPSFPRFLRFWLVSCRITFDRTRAPIGISLDRGRKWGRDRAVGFRQRIS